MDRREKFKCIGGYGDGQEFAANQGARRLYVNDFQSKDHRITFNFDPSIDAVSAPIKGTDYKIAEFHFGKPGHRPGFDEPDVIKFWIPKDWTEYQAVQHLLDNYKKGEPRGRR